MELRSEAHGPPRLSPFDPATMIQSLDEQGRGLRVVFFRPVSVADRWGHVIATVQDAGGADETVLPRLVSQEGVGTDRWPLSPPLQSLAIERRPEGSVALLVGMWGESHWSASFEAVKDRRLKIDIACRLGSGLSDWRLGSTYLINVGVTASSGQLALDLRADGRLLIEFGPEMEAKVLPGSVVLAVHSTPSRPVRWKYEAYCG